MITCKDLDKFIQKMKTELGDMREMDPMYIIGLQDHTKKCRSCTIEMTLFLAWLAIKANDAGHTITEEDEEEGKRFVKQLDNYRRTISN